SILPMSVTYRPKWLKAAAGRAVMIVLPERDAGEHAAGLERSPIRRGSYHGGALAPLGGVGSRAYNRAQGECRMGAVPKYSIIDPATGKIDRRIFSDQAIYDAEMEKIFGRAWLMIGHESLVPRLNDYFHTYMGEDPVILTRDGRGRLHALLNMCRHRGNRVV